MFVMIKVYNNIKHPVLSGVTFDTLDEAVNHATEVYLKEPSLSYCEIYETIYIKMVSQSISYQVTIENPGSTNQFVTQDMNDAIQRLIPTPGGWNKVTVERTRVVHKPPTTFTITVYDDKREISCQSGFLTPQDALTALPPNYHHFRVDRA